MASGPDRMVMPLVGKTDIVARMPQHETLGSATPTFLSSYDTEGTEKRVCMVPSACRHYPATRPAPWSSSELQPGCGPIEAGILCPKLTSAGMSS